MIKATMLPGAHDVARMVPMRQLLQVFQVRVRSSKRADCPLCYGRSKGTLAYTEGLWRCHRCNEGGDVFSLVRAVNHCDFPEALRFVARLAGIRLEDRRHADVRRELETRKRQRERLEHAARTLSALEQALLRECRDHIHEAEHTWKKISERLAALFRGEPERFRGEQEGLWLRMQAADVLLSAELPTYSLLSFGTPEDRSRFVLHPEFRNEIIAGADVSSPAQESRPDELGKVL